MNYNRVKLTYDIVLLLQQVLLRSIYSASAISVQGATQEANQSITDAELDLANINLRNAANNAYTLLQSTTRYNNTPFEYDVMVNGKRSIVFELWLNENWDTNLSTKLSTSIESLMVSHCLKDWFATRGQQLPFQLYSANYDTAEREIKSNINSRKTPVRLKIPVM